MTTIKATIQNRRIDVPAPSDLADGTEVTLTISQADGGLPLPPEEIARILAAMQRLESFDIPDNVASDLDDWERKINQHGIDYRDSSMEDAFS